MKINFVLETKVSDEEIDAFIQEYKVPISFNEFELGKIRQNVAKVIATQTVQLMLIKGALTSNDFIIKIQNGE